MADITDPKLVLWLQKSRDLANQMTTLKQHIDEHLLDYTDQGIAAAITAAGASEKIADGYATSGINAVTGTMLTNFKAGVLQLQTSWQTAVTGVGVPVTTIQNQIHTQ